MDEEGINDNPPKTKRIISPVIFNTFYFIMIGVSIIYGVRLWFDIPTHPSFLPLIGAVFAGILAFTIVMTLEYQVGPIEIKIGKDRGFSGAGGPIILWCLCFLVIIFGFSMLGIKEAIDKGVKPEDYEPCAIHTLVLWEHECPNKTIQPTANASAD